MKVSVSLIGSPNLCAFIMILVAMWGSDRLFTYAYLMTALSDWLLNGFIHMIGCTFVCKCRPQVRISHLCQFSAP